MLIPVLLSPGRAAIQSCCVNQFFAAFMGQKGAVAPAGRVVSGALDGQSGDGGGFVIGGADI